MCVHARARSFSHSLSHSLSRSLSLSPSLTLSLAISLCLKGRASQVRVVAHMCARMRARALPLLLPQRLCSSGEGCCAYMCVRTGSRSFPFSFLLFSFVFLSLSRSGLLSLSCSIARSLVVLSLCLSLCFSSFSLSRFLSAAPSLSLCFSPPSPLSLVRSLNLFISCSLCLPFSLAPRHAKIDR